VTDVIVLQKHLHGVRTLTASEAAAADLNCDATVDIFDLGLLKGVLAAAQNTEQ
jgi:hypothetical protein